MLVVAMVMLSSCTKKDSPPADNATSILGKWNFDSEIDWYTVVSTGLFQKDTTQGVTGEYSDFRTDGICYSKYYENGNFHYDTSGYVVNNNKVIFAYPNISGVDYDTLQIQTLTGNKLTLYQKYIYSGGTEEYWTNYSR